LLDEGGRLSEAVDCEKRTLDADSKYADAIFNIALFLQRLERHAEAAPWWRRYLEHDRDSPWAERAKRGLKYAKYRWRTLINSAPPLGGWRHPRHARRLVGRYVR
jgi:tetratricopeptide (TPR) repeat protein